MGLGDGHAGVSVYVDNIYPWASDAAVARESPLHVERAFSTAALVFAFCSDAAPAAHFEFATRQVLVNVKVLVALGIAVDNRGATTTAQRHCTAEAERNKGLYKHGNTYWGTAGCRWALGWTGSDGVVLGH